jgi:hypothetical protein
VTARVAAAGQILLIVLGVAWAVFERPVPVINVQWRDDVGAGQRQQLEREFVLEAGEESEGTWRYDLGRPDPSNIEAIVTSPAVRDTHHVNRSTYELDDDVAFSRLHLWWVGPFRGVQGRLAFRLAVALIASVTALCAWLACR